MMAVKNSNLHAARAPRDAAGQRSGLRPRWLLAMLAAGLIIATIPVLRREPAPAPPVIDLTGFEGIIAEQIQGARSEVLGQPRSGSAWGRLGLVLQAHELSDEARLCFARAERLAPNEPRWLYFHALLLAQESSDQAIDKFRQAADRTGAQQNFIRLRFAQALAEAGRIDEAEAQFKNLTQANTDQAPVALGLAGLARSRGHLDEARQLLQSCLKSPFTARQAHSLLGSIERQLGNTTAASTATQMAATLPPDQPWPDPLAVEAAQYRIGRKAWSDAAQQLLEQNRINEAEPIVAQLTKNYPDAPEGWLLLGRLRFVRNDCAAAEPALRRHLQLATNSVNGHFQLGIALLCLERYPESAASLQKAIELKPDFGEAHFNHGFALARSGRGPEAIAALRQAVRYSPDFVDSYVILADLLIQTGEKAEARSLLSRALQLNPNDERVKTLQERASR